MLGRLRLSMEGLALLRSRRLGLIAVLALVPAAAAGGYAAAAGGGAPTRHDLGQATTVAQAPGHTLGLARVVIPAHAKLPLHTHPGTEIARIEEGTLTYTVESGFVDVMRGELPGAKVVRRIGPGQTGLLRKGDWIVEQPDLIHDAANRTSKRIVVSLATMFPTGAPASEPAAMPAHH
jgi:quercetin dioxygenase-like cupin family protein